MRTLTVENKKMKLNSQSGITVILSVILMCSGNIQLLISVFPYIFMKSTLDKLIYILTSIILFVLYPNVFVENTVYITGYFILSFFIRNIRGNIIRINKYYVSLFAFFLTYAKTNDIHLSLSILVIQMLFYHEMMKSFEWLNKENRIPSTIYAICVIASMLLALQYMNEYQEIFITIGFIFICFGCSPLISITSLFMIHLYTPILSYEIFIYILLVSLLKEQIGLMIIVYIGLFFTQSVNIYEILILGLYLIFFLLLSKEGIPIQTNELKQSNIKSNLNKQLVHFSLIFDHLSTYYETISSVESNFLKSMSNALQYTSKKCIQDNSSHEFIKNQIICIFEGYDIGYEEIKVEIEEDGFIRIECSLIHFSANDVKEVLLPLLNHLLPTEMECLSMRSSWLELGILYVEFVSAPPIQIDAYADSTQVGLTCGDSFSIFHHSLKMYCLISDGMGRGNEASKISKCIVNLFQRMIFSNIHEIEAMNCINKLLLSDAYATCDILIFNRFKKIVTICKSAANPTYLIRNNELFAIWGNSLPIGIVAHIDVDHIHVHVEKGDLFVMSSDGVTIDEILIWMKGSKGVSARSEVERFMMILKEKERLDDSTILLAKVN